MISEVKSRWAPVRNRQLFELGVLSGLSFKLYHGRPHKRGRAERV